MIETIIAILQFIGSPLIAVSRRVRDRRVSVKEIKKPRHRCIDDCCDLYERLFKEEHRIPSSDVVAWLTDQNGSTPASDGLRHCLLVGLNAGKVVAILKALYHPGSHYAFIAYLGVDKENPAARQIASRVVLRFFRKYIEKRWCGVEAVLFETARPRTGLNKVENSERRARIRLYKDIARRQGLRGYEIDVEYVQPHFADATTLAGRPERMALMAVPLHNPVRSHLTAEVVQGMLSFIYLRIYSETQTVSPSRSQNYSDYLHKLYSNLVNALPAKVPLT